MKQNYLLKSLMMALVVLFSSPVFAEETETEATVKMTYVDGETTTYDNTDKCFYEETQEQGYAKTGYNAIKNGKVTLPQPTWKHNKLTIMQISMPDVEGAIVSVKLSLQGSGTSDAKRNAKIAVGIAGMEWSDDLTWNSCKPTAVAFTQLGTTVSLENGRNPNTFKTAEFDITNAFVGTDKKEVTLFVLHTDADEIKIKNPKVTITSTPLETMKVNASGFTTYAASYPVKYSEIGGVKAYTIGLDETAKTVTYKEFTGVVPANQAVLVAGDASQEYELSAATEVADGTFETALLASDGQVTAADGLYYAFGSKDEKVGFKRVADDVVIPAKKGYLKLTKETAESKEFFGFDNSTTGINMIPTSQNDEDAPLYNLAGQRVDKSYKGLVIVNGKKVLKK